MNKEKDPKKLTAEELEKRVAPAALTYDPGVEEPTSPKGSKAPGKDGGPGPTGTT